MKINTISRYFLHKKNLFYLFIPLFLLSGCTTSPNSKFDIKNDFCGVHINYQYCKCAFHNDYCENIGMSKGEAKVFVDKKFDEWVDGQLDEEKEVTEEKYGIIEKDGNLHLNSKPGEVLSITTDDLPVWARDQIATVGAMISVVGPLDSIIEGDASVLLDGLPVARLGDKTAHGGAIVEGSKNIFVNGQPVAFIGGRAVDPTIIGGGLIPSVGGPIISNINK